MEVILYSNRVSYRILIIILVNCVRVRIIWTTMRHRTQSDHKNKSIAPEMLNILLIIIYYDNCKKINIFIKY